MTNNSNQADSSIPCCEISEKAVAKKSGLQKRMHLLGWVLGLGSLYIFFEHFFEWAKFQESMRQADWGLLVLAIGNFMLAVLFRSVRWTFMVQCLWPGLTWMQGFYTVMSSNMINFLFPVRLGEVVKLVIVRKAFNIPYSASAAASIVEKLTLFLIMLFCLSFTSYVGFRFPAWSARFFPFLLVLLGVSVALFFFGVKGLHGCTSLAEVLLRKIGLRQGRVDSLLHNRLTCFAEETLRQCHATAYSAGQFAVVVSMGVLILALDGLANYFLLQAFGLHLTYLQAVIAACFFNLLFLLPSPPAQVGTAEIYPVLIYAGGLKLPAAAVASAAIIWHMVTAGVIIFFGVCSLYAIGLRLSSVVSMSRQTDEENA